MSDCWQLVPALVSFCLLACAASGCLGVVAACFPAWLFGLCMCLLSSCLFRDSVDCLCLSLLLSCQPCPRFFLTSFASVSHYRIECWLSPVLCPSLSLSSLMLDGVAALLAGTCSISFKQFGFRILSILLSRVSSLATFGVVSPLLFYLSSLS